MNENEVVFHWRFVSHLNVGNGKRSRRHTHYLMHRDNELGAQRETISQMDELGLTCYKSEVSYFLDGDEQEYASEAELRDAVLRKRTQA